MTLPSLSSSLICRTKPTPRLWIASFLYAFSFIAAALLSKLFALGPVSGFMVAMLPAVGCGYFLHVASPRRDAGWC